MRLWRDPELMQKSQPGGPNHPSGSGGRSTVVGTRSKPDGGPVSGKCATVPDREHLDDLAMSGVENVAQFKILSFAHQVFTMHLPVVHLS